MTRFARAKGSKASNERIPNEATPWCVMKQQIDNSSTKNERPEKMKTAKELLQEKDDPFYYDTTGNVNTDWAEISGESSKGKKIEKTENQLNSKKNKRKLQNESTEEAEKNLQESDNLVTPKKVKKENVDGNDEMKKKKKKNKKNHSDNVENNEIIVEDTNSEPRKKMKKKDEGNDSCEVLEISNNSELQNENNSEARKKKKKKSQKIEYEEKTEKSEKSISLDSEEKTEKSEKNISPDSEEKIEKSEKNVSLKVSKRHKRNQKRIEKNALLAAANGEEKVSRGFDAAGNDWSSNVNFGKREKFEKGENKNDNGVNGNLNDFKKSQQINRNGDFPKKKAPKIRDDKEHKRRKPDAPSIKCVINGKDVEIVKFDRFPVKKEDAERLKELRQQMVMKGIPKSEIEFAIKMERRRAEKALARMRKEVCFHCRKTGHNLSDCPDLGEEEQATGICFKCGSTEHTHFDCKVTKKEEFRFASCFICREQGHIAKQCPDNPKGLYPKGGSCKICGDVTHLRKDCPDLKQEKEEAEVTLNTIGESTLESLEEEKPKKIDDEKKTKGKIVKF